jgi:pSer/pThr/pTyr-binding forkhead associated (FHA) protein
VLKLIIEDDEGRSTSVPVDQDEITIGRKEGNLVRLTDQNVSRQHARLIRSNSALFIEDLDSYNGVKVNGNRITARTTIRESDQLEIGDYRLSFRQIAEAEHDKERVADRDLTVFNTIEPPQADSIPGNASVAVHPAPEDPSVPPGDSYASENFIKPKEASVASPAKESLANRKLFLGFGALAAVALIGVGAYVFLQAISSPNNNTQTRKSASASADASTSTAKTSIDFQIGMDRLSAHDYDAALKNFEAALTEDPANTQYKEMRDKSIKEKDAALSLGKLQALIADKNWDQALQISIPPNTYAGKQAAALRPEVEDLFKTSHLKLGKRALDKGHYADAVKQADAVLAVDENDDAANKLKQAAERPLVADAKTVKNVAAPLPDKRKPDSAQINTALGPDANQALDLNFGKTKETKPLAVKSPETSASKPQETNVAKAPEPAPVKAPEPKPNKVNELQDLRGNALKLFNEGKLEEAITLFQKALKADPSDCALYRYLGTAYVKINDKAKAHQAFVKFVEVCPNDVQAPMVRETIERYEKE